ncbi:MAG: amidohydrolase family protein [Sphingomonas sp.]|uniref:amidohydrolase family protein n=1 Tax=Sphingomonas sp. TaxID=28214 RepID=UPI003563E1DC
MKILEGAMKRRLLGLALTGLLSSSVLAQTPVDQLAKPPADARHFIIESTGGKHGDSWSWIAPDGTRMARESMNLRGQVWEIDYRGVAGSDGMPADVAIHGVTPQGDAAETFVVSGGKAQWKSQIDSGSAAYGSPAFYATVGGPMDTTAWFVERLLASSTKSLHLLPGGEAHAAMMTTLKVGSGAAQQTVTLWSITGVGTTPLAIWADAHGKFFGLTLGIAWLPEAYAGEMHRLEAAQAAAMAAQAPIIAKTLVTVPRAAVAFTHVRLFDADGLRFLDDQSVVVSKGVITAVGAARSVRVPAGARVIDGKGMTLVPGLWDCHMHVGDDYTGPQELSLGVTSVRDPGNNDQLTIDRRARVAAGKLLFPHVYPSSLIDGKGPYTAQVANVATSQDEAIALVRKARANGFTGVKFYGTFNPAWLPATIAEAHKLGLHVHGHIPAGIRTSTAIADGYDEITHINWIMMEAMPASVLPTDNGIDRFEAPGRYAKDVDLDGPALSGLIATMAQRHIYADPTMVAFEGLYVPENGELSPAYAPFVGTMPPTTERGFRAGGFAVPKDLTRADYRASWARMVALLGKMHKAGVPIVAGTDGSGIELIRELEIYREAGFSPAEALAAATIVPARLVGQDRHTGSIKVGKTADLVLVQGDPSQRIGDLRQTRLVMLDGKLLDADALRRAAGFSGRPK